MSPKKLKYSSFLINFPNCPPDNFKEVEKNAFRWVHSEVIENDFLPLSCIKEPPQRVLEESDLLCMSYGLSMFVSKEQSIDKYRKLCEKLRLHQKKQFIEDKGNAVAFLSLEKEDGLADEPNKEGHFTFHEYDTVNLEQKIQEIYKIINEDGEFIRPTQF